MEQNDRAQSTEEIVRRIDEIKARCDRATPGAWRDVERGNSVISHGVVTVAYDGLPQQNVCAGISPKTGNATFIAHAREDIPYLLQLVEAQAAEIAELRDEVGSMRRCDESNRQIYLNLRSRLSERDREIIKLKLEKELMRQEWETAMAQLTASQQETRAAVEDACRIAAEYLSLCDRNCGGDRSAGVQPCPFWNPPDVGMFGEPLPCGCELEDYCGPQEAGEGGQ